MENSPSDRDGNETQVDESTLATLPQVTRVMAFVDGFNLYHALDWFDRGVNEDDKMRFQKYKWLCLTSLVRKFILSKSEELVGVRYFTTYPHWDLAKQDRHRKYVMAQIAQGVTVEFGDFKPKTVKCKGTCKTVFNVWEEKQTDVNIAVRMLEFAAANAYDKLILVSGDSDQVPALKLIRKLHSEKIIASLIPIGRGANEIYQVCKLNYTMTEQHLKDCQLPDTVRWDKVGIDIAKPASWKTIQNSPPRA